MTAWAEKGLYGDDVVHAETTPYQRLVVTRWHDDLRLYINNNLQFSSRDEHRYHESLVHPGLQTLPWAQHRARDDGGPGPRLDRAVLALGTTGQAEPGVVEGPARHRHQ
ncbi:hypothetical protein G6F22_020967 [Rhizopus arrhizus]|nr:hypothetical protein G6F22_020967 [Rhizopus arrhizus]